MVKTFRNRLWSLLCSYCDIVKSNSIASLFYRQQVNQRLRFCLSCAEFLVYRTISHLRIELWAKCRVEIGKQNVFIRNGLKCLVTNCSILYAITIKHLQFYGWKLEYGAVNIFKSMMLICFLPSTFRRTCDEIDFFFFSRYENTFDTIYNFRFDSIP